MFSIFLTYYLGTLSNKENKKHEVDLKRYELFYIPYINTLMADYKFTDEPSAAPLENRSIYFDLVMKNSQYLGDRSSRLIIPYYKSFLDLFEMNKPGYENSDIIFNEVFLSITKTVLQEAEELSKSLKYPNLAKSILDTYDF